jgi:hypothetical protein
MDDDFRGQRGQQSPFPGRPGPFGPSRNAAEGGRLLDDEVPTIPGSRGPASQANANVNANANAAPAKAQANADANASGPVNPNAEGRVSPSSQPTDRDMEASRRTVRRPARRSRFGTLLVRGFMVSMLLALAVVLFAGTLYVARGGNPTEIGSAVATAFASRNGPSATPTPVHAVPAPPTVSTHKGATPGATNPSGGGGGTGSNPQPTATPSRTKNPTPTPTAAPHPPHLSVSPHQGTGNCVLGAYPDLTVQNDGGGQLTWSAHTGDPLILASPASGSLAGGDSTSVSLSGIHVGASFTVTITSNGGSATTTITCK